MFGQFGGSVKLSFLVIDTVTGACPGDGVGIVGPTPGGAETSKPSSEGQQGRRAKAQEAKIAKSRRMRSVANSSPVQRLALRGETFSYAAMGQAAIFGRSGFAQHLRVAMHRAMKRVPGLRLSRSNRSRAKAYKATEA